jgi:hypothetical protein
MLKGAEHAAGYRVVFLGDQASHGTTRSSGRRSPANPYMICTCAGLPAAA